MIDSTSTEPSQNNEWKQQPQHEHLCDTLRRARY